LFILTLFVCDNDQTFHLAQAKLASREAELGKLNSESSNDAEKALKEARLEELTGESHEASELKRQVEQQLKLAQAPIRKLERDHHQVQRELEQASQRLKAAETRLREVHRDMKQREAESEQIKRLEALESCKEKLAALVEEEKTLREKQSNELRNYQDIEPLVDAAKGVCQNMERQIGAVRHKIVSLQNSRGNSAAVYGGPNAAKLAAQVMFVMS
jgi:chromosome segregation ATPase